MTEPRALEALNSATSSIKFYRTVEDGAGTWYEIPADTTTPASAYHESIYNLSHNPDNNDAPVKYSGKLTWDLDYKHPDGTPHLELAIKECNQLIDELIKMGVPEEAVELFASGSKGFHLTIAGRMFGAHRSVEKLPQLHRFMVSVISGRAGLTGTDLSLYCLGKTKMLRVAGMRRANLRYKVPVKVAEVRTMTPEIYIELTSQPRTRDWDIAEPKDVNDLFELYKAAILAR